MKLQEQGLISLDWLNAQIRDLEEAKAYYLKENSITTVQWLSAKISILEEVKEQIISPIPLAEKILNEGVEIGYISTSSKEGFKEDCAKLLKQTFLNSDIQLD